MTKYNDRAAIITGASGGLGQAISLALAKGGMEVWLVGRTKTDLEAVAAKALEAGAAGAHPVQLDLDTDGALAELVQEVGRLHPHLYALINNAGIMHLEPIMSGRTDRWRAMFNVNVMTPLQGCRAAVEVMRAHGKPGHLINVSSLTSRFDAGGVYGASKLAQEMISRSLRKELERDDIRITSIVPGGFVSKLARDLEPATIEAFITRAKEKGVDFTNAADPSFLGDPVHVANVVEYILDQPIWINLQEVIIRPPVSVEF